jgi:hypothetical protein
MMPLHTKLNDRKEETNIPIKGLVLLILGLHYPDFDAMLEIMLGDTLPPFAPYVATRQQ